MPKKSSSDGLSSAQDRRDARVLELLPTWMSPVPAPQPGLAPISITNAPHTSTIDSKVVRRSRKGIGRYLEQSKVLLVKDESDRTGSIEALEAAGYEVLNPLRKPVNDELIFNGAVRPAGSWGNIIIFDATSQNDRHTIRVAIVDLDKLELICVSDRLAEPLLRRLELMGLDINYVGPASPVGDLNSKLAWDIERWEGPLIDPKLLRMPTEDSGRLTSAVASELPAEVVAAFEEQMKKPGYNPMTPRRRGGGYWERQNGVLNLEDLDDLRAHVPDGEQLPPGWEDAWRDAMELSAPHAPSLCALYLHERFPDWWETLPPIDLPPTGTWLLGHSHAKPKWLKYDRSGAANGKLNTAVSLIVSAVGDLSWLRKESHKKQTCALCRAEFEKGMLQAGEIYLLESSHICTVCWGRGWPGQAEHLTPAEEAGLIGAIRALVDRSGGVISVSMLLELKRPADISPEAWFVLNRPLPQFVTGAWGQWLDKAGVLGENWRPSRGHHSTAKDGHPCRSLLERVIDDYFLDAGIAHEIEPPYPYDADLNPHGSLADWVLADGTFVEAAGMLGSATYAAKMERKRQLAVSHGLSLIVVEDADLKDLSKIFAKHRP